MRSRMLLIVGIGTFAAALCTGCGGTFCDEYPEACENVGGGGGGEEGPNIDGVLQSGAILCADCAASPFCYDMAQDPPLFVYLQNETDLCPGALFKAEPAIRRTASGGQENFFCVPPNDEDDFAIEGAWCSGGLATHSAVDECGADHDDVCVGDACLNDECTTHHGQIVTLCGKDDAFVDTPDEFEKSAAKTQDKIIEAAGNYHHPNVPGNFNADPNDPEEPLPQRYCFVTCFDESLYTNPVACDPIDDPWLSATSTLVAIDPEATITLNTTDENGHPHSTTTDMDIDGAIAIDIPRACRDVGGGESASCDVGIGSLLLRGHGDLVVQGFDVSKLAVINRVNWAASATAVEGTTTILLDSAPALVTATVHPFGRFGLRQELAGVSGVLDWKDRTYESTATFRDPSGNGSTELTFTGTIPNIPPQADAGSDQTFECTGDGKATVTLTAGGTDADGNEDLASFMWSREIARQWLVSSGPTLTTAFPLGTSSVILTALDSARAKDMDGVKITVVDTQDPAFVSIEVAPGSLWPADGRLHLFRLGQEIRSEVADTCDPSPAVSIVDMSGSGDFAFDEGAICIRAAASGAANPLRNYTVTVEALDASGNWAEEDVVITNADFAPAVADDDPRCP